MSKKVLFLPNDLGGGLGHVRRCILLAKLLKYDGWKVSFLIHHSKSLQHLENTYKIFYIPFTLEKFYVALRARIKPIHFFPEKKLVKQPYFWEFNSLNFQVLRDGYFTSQIVYNRFYKLSQIVNNWKPNLIIGDGHLMAYFLGKKFGIPVLQLMRYAVFPDNENLIWWKNIPESLISPPSTKAFLELCLSLNLEPDLVANKYLAGDGYLFPGTPDIEPIQTQKSHLFFGYFVESNWDGRLLNIDKKKRLKKIYITIGGGAQRSHVSEYYHFLIEALKDLKVQLIISDPFEILTSTFNRITYPNVSIYKWIESATVAPYLDLVIHHGGYGTTLESLWWGVPSVIIPFHSEQEGNGRRLEFLKAGKVLQIAREPYLPVKFHTYYGEATMLGGFDFCLDRSEFISIIKKILTKTEFRENAKIQSQQLRSLFNPVSILDFIKKYS